MLFYRSVSLFCAALLLTSQSVAYAQIPTMMQAQGAVDSNQETIDLLVGDIFEILPAHTLGPNATYTWILTQDRNFIEAGRAQTFRKRLIQPGRYTLYAEISNDTAHVSRTFILDYKSRLPGQVGASGSNGSGTTALVQTIPTLTANNSAVLKNGSQLVKLMPVNPDIRPLVLDVNIAEDVDGDGNPANDIQSDLTFFQTDATPLFVWFASPLTTQTMTITAALPAGAMVQTIQVASDAYAQDQGFAESPVGVSITKISDRSYSFTAKTDSTIPEQTPLLYVWEFGDGQQSLLASPTHEYAADGDYVVKLRVRNLTNGQDVANYTEELSVAGGNDAVSSEPTEPNEQPVTEPSTEGGMLGSLGGILLLVGVFIGSIVVGVLAMIGISKMRRKGGTRLSDTLEKMEQSIVKKDEATPPPLTIAPVVKTPVEPQTPPAVIAEREKENTDARPTPIPTKVEEKNAPAWLKSGLSAPAVQAPASPTPAPASPVVQTPKPATPPVQKPQTPPPAPTPVAPEQPKVQTPPPAPKQSAVNNLQSAPAWLQQKTPAPVAEAKPQTPPPAPKPTAPAPAAPTPAPVPPKPVATPAAPVTQAPNPQNPPVEAKPAPNATPAWLQQAQQKAASTEQPKPSTPPAPPAPKPATPSSAAPAPTPNADQTVAFIRADSLDQNPKPDTTQNPPPAAA